MNVSDIGVGKPDSSGLDILRVFARRPPYYAVYLTRDQIAIHYSDIADIEEKQRSAIAKLNPLRNDINSLIDGWRTSSKPRLAAKATRYNNALAAGLVSALEDDFDGAQTQLEKTKADILNERTSWARFQYLMVASAACVGSILICSLLGIRAIWNFIGFRDHYVPMLFLAGGTGAVGAFFSIAIFIRRRTILTDLRGRDNFADAVLRILIGQIAGALFVGFLRSDLINFGLNGNAIKVEPNNWIMAMLAAFLAGFSEQLIPDLLARAAQNGLAGAAAVPADAKPPPKKEQEAPADQGAKDMPDKDAHADGCATDTPVTASEATKDADLPPAIGGVASGQ